MSETIHILAGNLPQIERRIQGPPLHIQFLPPGEQPFEPMEIDGERNEDRQRMRIVVTKNDADVLQRVLNSTLQEYMAGKSPRPWLDERHENQKAVGWPTEFFWGGDDPKTGGIRLMVEWNDYGRELLSTKAYNYFSPSLIISKKPDGNGMNSIMGFTSCIGGLVNEPAFRGIQQISAGTKPAATTTQKQNSMAEPNTTLGELNNQLTTLCSTVAALTGRITSLEQAAKGFADKAIVTQSSTQLQELQDKINKSVQSANERAAVAIVASAIAAGRIAPQDEAAKKSWTEIITQDPSRIDLLNKLPVNPALQAVTGGTPAEKRVAADDKEVARAARVRNRADEIQRTEKCSYSTAWNKANAEVQ